MGISKLLGYYESFAKASIMNAREQLVRRMIR
jgi:hypothetical protein